MAAPNMTVSLTPPVAPAGGDLWWRIDKGDLYIFYDDGVSSQWVIAVVKASGGGGSGGGFDIQPVSAGGTGLPSIASGGVVVGSGANPVQVLAPSNGQVLAGSSGAAVWATSLSITEITVPFIDGVQVIASDPASPLIIGTAGSSIFLSNGSTFSIEVINGNVYPNGPFTGTTDLGDDTRHFGRVCVGFVELFPDSSHATVLLPVASGTVVSPVSITLPGITDTLVGRITTDTLLHKTLSGATISGGVIAGTLSGGTISGATILGGTISGGVLTGTLSGGTLSGAILSGGVVVSAGGLQVSSGGGASHVSSGVQMVIDSGASFDIRGQQIVSSGASVLFTNAGSKLTMAIGAPLVAGTITGITAFAAGGQTSATSLTASVSHIGTAAFSGASVLVSAMSAGTSQLVINGGANIVSAFPPSGWTINALGSNSGIAISVGKATSFVCPASGALYTVP